MTMTTITPVNESYIAALRDITVTLFETMLQTQVVPQQLAVERTHYEITAAVGYAGAGKGGVLLECYMEQAKDWCSSLCSIPAPVSVDDARDGLGELCNILAGNLKTLLPQGSTLATPLVWEGSTQHRLFAGCELVGTTELIDRGKFFRVSLFLG